MESGLAKSKFTGKIGKGMLNSMPFLCFSLKEERNMALSKIDTVYIVKLSNNHVPYVLGCKVVGPKGWAYMLDKFNFEQLLKNYDKGRYMAYNDILERIVVRNTLKVYIRNFAGGDKAFIDLARNLHLKPLVRLSGLEKTKRLARDLGFTVKMVTEIQGSI